MYTGDHVDRRICPICGTRLTPPSDGGCYLCWHGPERGLLVTDDQLGVWVHQGCLDYFGVDDVVQWERQYIDIGSG
jgi:hypothetical protein